MTFFHLPGTHEGVLQLRAAFTDLGADLRNERQDTGPVVLLNDYRGGRDIEPRRPANDREQIYRFLLDEGYSVPDHGAAWTLAHELGPQAPVLLRLDATLHDHTFVTPMSASRAAHELANGLAVERITPHWQGPREGCHMLRMVHLPGVVAWIECITRDLEQPCYPWIPVSPRNPLVPAFDATRGRSEARLIAIANYPAGADQEAERAALEVACPKTEIRSPLGDLSYPLPPPIHPVIAPPSYSIDFVPMDDEFELVAVDLNVGRVSDIDLHLIHEVGALANGLSPIPAMAPSRGEGFMQVMALHG